MILLHNIGTTEVAHAKSNYNTASEIEGCPLDLSFDGIYKNVWEHRDLLKGRKALLFVMGDYIGKDNSFDTGMPLEQYCTQEQLNDLVEDGHVIGWHTYTHPDLTTITLEEAKKEMKCPWDGVKDLAYPYGTFNEDLMGIAKELGYERAWSVTQGNDNPYSLFRSYL